VLHLQKVFCIKIAHNGNVPIVPQNIAFCHVAMDGDDDADADASKINSNGEDLIMEVNDNRVKHYQK